MLPEPIIYIAAVLYLIFPLVMRFQPLLKPYGLWVNLAGFASLAVCLFRQNRFFLRDAARKGRDAGNPEASILWKNRLWVFLLLVVVLAVSFLRELERATEIIFVSTLRAMLWLLAFVGSLFNQSSADREPAPPQAPTALPMVAAKNHPLLDLFYRIFTYVIIALAVFFLLRLFWRKGRPYLATQIRRLLVWLKRERPVVKGRGFVDEKETLLELADAPRLVRRKIGDWLNRFRRREARWSELTDNRSKVRFLYRTALRRSIRKGYRHHPGRTPAETCRELEKAGYLAGFSSEELANLYIGVRYGDKTPDDGTVNRIAGPLIRS
jgi:hypothetical protein